MFEIKGTAMYDNLKSLGITNPDEIDRYSLYCAVIVKKVDAKTRGKVGINELLRTID